MAQEVITANNRYVAAYFSFRTPLKGLVLDF